MSPKKYIKIMLGILLILVCLGVYVYTNVFPENFKVKQENLLVNAKTSGKEIIIKSEKDFEKFNIKGVNLGAGKPGYFPNEFSITKEEYLRWFQDIYNMNANVIRTYIIASPQFYEAFYEFNINKEKNNQRPLYLIHGVWVNEEDIASKMNALDYKIKGKFLRDIKQTINVVHGKCYIPPNGDYANGRYTKNISRYVLGYILGIEWDGVFAELTNFLNDGNTSYMGKYMYTAKGSNTFERFLAEAGDYAIKYETENYNQQRLIAFSNWPTTDPLEHPYEPEQYNAAVNIDVEKIIPTKEFKSGVFASYHVYPYYPDFLNLDPKYNSYRDELGRRNSYRAYLTDLNKHHSMPVVISEFGIPTSRGVAHIDESRGYNHGGISEEEQAKATVDLYNDIKLSGCNGGIVFAWQDEWFKKSWNVMETVDLERSAYWHNFQVSEQNYGILAFDQGKSDRVVPYPDGNISEWKNAAVVSSNEDMSLSMISDEKYIYMKVNKKGFDIEKDKIYIPIDTTPISGSKKSSLLGLDFDRNVDFVVEINGKDNSRVYVHDYYNPLVIDVDMYPETEKISGNITKNVDKFNKIYLIIRNKIVVGPEKKEHDAVHFETGKLNHGNASTNGSKYNPLIDFNISGDNIEIRLPWQLLNFSDPSKKAVVGDIRKSSEGKDIKIDKIYASLISKSEDKTLSTKSGSFSWKTWNQPKYHERLKPVYYSLKEAFKSK